MARAALEAIAWRVADIVEAMAEVAPVASAARRRRAERTTSTLLQIQADALGLPLAVGRADATVLGAAMLAGVGAGMFTSLQDAAQRLPAGRIVAPSRRDGRATATARALARVHAPAREL